MKNNMKSLKKALSFEALQLKNCKTARFIERARSRFYVALLVERSRLFLFRQNLFSPQPYIKTQGTTLDSSFVYTSDFAAAKNIDLELYYQLLYVAITRAKNQVHFI